MDKRIIHTRKSYCISNNQNLLIIESIKSTSTIIRPHKVNISEDTLNEPRWVVNVDEPQFCMRLHLAAIKYYVFG